MYPVLKASDIVFLICSITFTSNFLIVVLFLSRKYIEKWMNKTKLSKLLKITLFYILFVMPFFAEFILYKSTYQEIRPFNGSDGLNRILVIHNQSFASVTGYGMHWTVIFVIMIWGSGILIKFIRYITKEKTAEKILEKTSYANDNSSIERLNKELSYELGIRKQTPVFINSLIEIPFAKGWWKTVIYFPERVFTEEEKKLLLKHELLHCKKKDYLYRECLNLLNIIYWFNPLLDKFTEYFIEVNEIACDEQVLNGISSENKYCYAKLLVSLTIVDETNICAVSFSGHMRSSLERRLENMTKVTEKKMKLVVFMWSMFILMMCPLTTYAAATTTSLLQDKFSRVLSEGTEEDIQENTAVEQYEQNKNVNIVTNFMNLQTRGVTVLDENISSRTLVKFGNVDLSVGSTVSFNIWGENKTDQFIVGLIDSSGKKRYVSSNDGGVDHTFSITSAGKYTVFLEERAGKNIHVEGSIAIRQ